MTSNLRIGGARAALAAVLVLSTVLTIPAAGAAEPDLALGGLPATQEAHWAFDDESGTVAADSSGNGWDANLVAGPVWTTGLFDGAVSLDGVDDYVNADSGLLDGVGDATVATWAKLGSSGTHTLLSGANSGNSNEILLIIKSATEIRFFTGETAGDYVSWNVPAIDDGKWHHLAFVRNVVGDALELYLDGASQGSKSAPVSALQIETGGLIIGQEQDSVGGGFDLDQAFGGLLDDYRIYDSTLTAQEIAALATPPEDATPPSAPGNLAAWSNGLAVNLSWTAASDGESGISAYRIYRDIVSDGSKTLLVEVSSDELSYVDTATDPLTTYYYEVAAVNGDDLEGPMSQEVNATTADGPGPGDPDVLGYWSLDDATGTVAEDGSSHGNDGTVVGSASWASGKIGGGLRLGPAADLVDVHKRVLDDEDTITVALWAKLSSGGTHALISAANNNNSNELLLLLKTPSKLRFFTGESNSSRVEWSIPSLNDGVWHHVAVVRDSANDEVELFIDGQSQGTVATPLRKLNIVSGGLVFGEDQDSVGGGFDADQALDGKLDEVWFYNRVLDAEEIGDLALYTPDEVPPSAPSNLVATADGLDIGLTWDPATDDDSGVDKYRVYRGPSSEGPWTKISTRDGDSTSYNDRNTLPDTKYYYFIKAVDGAGNVGDPSNVAHATTDDADGTLIGHFELDEIEGGVATDSSTQNEDATLKGSPTWSPGIIDGGLHLDPPADYLKLRRATLNGEDTISVAMWVNAEDPGTHTLLSGANAGNSNEILLLIKGDDKVRFFTGRKTNSYAEWTVPVLTDNEWHHVAVNRDSVANKVELFVDGVSYGKVSKTLSPLDISAGGLIMGQDQDSVGGGFDVDQALHGTLDDVRFYNRTLSAAEVEVLAGAS